jgi:hypothetical protein
LLALPALFLECLESRDGRAQQHRGVRALQGSSDIHPDFPR